MKFKNLLTVAMLAAAFSTPSLANDGTINVTSPDGHITATVVPGTDIRYMVSRDGQQLIAPSVISMHLSDGIVFGQNDRLRKVTRTSVDQTLPAVAYKKSEVRDNYNQITLTYKEFNLIFRAYDEGVAYRFVSRLDKKKEYEVISEQAEFNFEHDGTSFIPYTRLTEGDPGINAQFSTSFERQYTVSNLSEWENGRITFLPMVVSAGDGVRVLVTEADLTDYPGMYLQGAQGSTNLKAVFAPYPKTIEQGGHNMLQGIVKERENYIAKVRGGETFPWRVIMVSSDDAQLAVNDIVWKLSPAADKDADFSWVKPGKVAWEWWNDWNLYGVDFKAGINNETYKYYIDFASENGIGYVILDEGWAVNLQADLLQVVPEINLQELVDYGKERNVGIILWAGYWALNRDIEGLCKHFSEMGVKGFKVDFMDRDDQMMVNFHARTAEIAAKYNLLIDFHGTYKPTGLSRRWPNVINYEGVYGLEQMKWGGKELAQVTYDVTVPFIRMAAGPMDYTQGAMRNAAKKNFRSVNSEAMSQGTRCHQLAEYVVFESPLNMLCDSPSNYMNEPECTAFIAACPTVWDDSRAVNGEIGKYITLARRSGDDWYVGALTDWDARDLTLDLSFLGEGDWTLDIFQDGVNADRAARDYKHTSAAVPADRQLTVHLAPGGGWVAKITRR